MSAGQLRSTRADWAQAAGVAAALFALYALTAPRTVALEDDGLFVLSSYFLGIEHPPGFPLFTLIGVGLALILAAYQLVELSRVGRKGVRPGPMTRGLQSVSGPIAQRRNAKANREREVGEE